MVGGKLNFRRVVVWLARIVLAGVFIYAGWQKARDPGQFIRDIWNFRLLPEGLAYWVAAFVPYLEIVVGVGLIVGPQRRGAHAWIALLLVVFLAFIISAWGRGLEISCGCFGAPTAGESTNYPWLVARDLLLISALAVSIFVPLRKRVT